MRTLFKKELLENWRNFKWIWVPLVFMLLTIMDPLMTYYLPQIIDKVGGIPEGASFEIPTPSPEEAIMMSLAQLSSLGVLVLVLISMGTIAGERKRGITELILVKPVAHGHYVIAKWLSYLLLSWTSLSLGLLISWYYINILFGALSFFSIATTFIFYGLWLTLVITVSIFYNTIFKTPGIVAALSIMTFMVMSIVTQIFSHVLTWSPNKLSEHIQKAMVMGEWSTDLIGTAIVTIVISVILLVASIYIFKTKEMAE